MGTHKKRTCYLCGRDTYRRSEICKSCLPDEVHRDGILATISPNEIDDDDQLRDPYHGEGISDDT